MLRHSWQRSNTKYERLPSTCLWLTDLLQLAFNVPKLVFASVQALQVKATSHLVKALTSTEAGQLGLLQGLQRAMSEDPGLKHALSQLVNGASRQS